MVGLDVCKHVGQIVSAALNRPKPDSARIDALRKVMYGGDRSTDTVTDTVLERTYVPQDAHSWGKEYAWNAPAEPTCSESATSGSCWRPVRRTTRQLAKP